MGEESETVMSTKTTQLNLPGVTPAAEPPVKGRYIMFRLLRQFLALKPSDQHDCLLSAEFSVEESIALTKAFNGLKYHKMRRRQASFLSMPREF